MRLLRFAVIMVCVSLGAVRCGGSGTPSGTGDAGLPPTSVDAGGTDAGSGGGSDAGSGGGSDAGSGGGSDAGSGGGSDAGSGGGSDAGSGGGSDAGSGGGSDAGSGGGSDAGSGGGTDAGSGGGSDAGTPGPLGGGDWPQYRQNVTGTSENPSTFDKAAAASLTQIWTAELGQYVYTQPVIQGGVAYFTTAFTGRVVALDLATGHTLWSRTLNAPITTSCDKPQQTGFWGSAAVVGDLVYVASPDGNVYALHKSDGSTLWASPVANGTPSGNGEQMVSSPMVSTALGKIYLGVAASSGATCGYVPGRVVSLDLSTGASHSRVLVDPGQTGAPVWSSISVDEPGGVIYASSGDAFDGKGSPEPLSNSILELAASDDLTVLDHWQNPTTLTDADFGASPTLFTAADGTPLVAAASKDGFLYVLKRGALAAGPVWSYHLANGTDPANPTIAGDPVGGRGSIVSPTFANGTLYAAGELTPSGDAPGSVVAFDPGTGALKWRHLTPGYVIAPVAAAGEVLFVESGTTDFKNGYLEVLDATTGAVLKTVSAGKAIFGAPAVAHGVVIVVDGNGHVTALAAPAYR